MADESEEEILKIIVDDSNAIESFGNIVKAFEEQGDALNTLGDYLKEFDTTGKATIFTLKAMNDIGQKATITIEEQADGWKILNSTITDTSAKLAEQNKIMAEAAQVAANKDYAKGMRDLYKETIEVLNTADKLEQKYLKFAEISQQKAAIAAAKEEARQEDLVYQSLKRKIQLKEQELAIEDRLQAQYIKEATAANLKDERYGAATSLSQQVGGALTGSLSENAARATTEELNAAALAQSRFTNLVATGAVTQQRAYEIFNNVLRGTNENYKANEIAVASAAQNTIKAHKQLASSYDEQNEKMNKLSDSYTKAKESGENASKGLLISWQSLGRFIATHIIYSSLYSLYAAFRQATEAAAEFEIKISEIRTISQGNQQSIEEWTSEVRKLSDEFNKPIADVAAGAYQALSSQIAHGAETVGFLTEALKFSQVTNSTTEQSVNLLTSALDSFHLSADQAGRVSAGLFKTIELGKVRAEDMAGSFGRVASLSYALGISLEETNAAISTLTRSGIKFNEAQTLIGALNSKLLKPTKELKELFAQWGVETGQQAISTFGYVGVLQKLEAATAGNAAETAELFSNIRAVRGALSLTGSAFKDYQRDLNDVKNAEASYNNAKKIAQESAGYDIQKQFNELKNQVLIDFGTKTIDNFSQLTKSLGTLKDVYNDLFHVVKIGLPAFALFRLYVKLLNTDLLNSERTAALVASGYTRLEIASAELQIAIRGIGTAFKTVLPLLIISAILEVISYISNADDRLKAAQEHIQEEFDKNHEKRLEAYQHEAQVSEEAFDNALNSQFQKLDLINSDLVKQAENYSEAIKDAFGETKKTLSEISQAFIEQERTAFDALKDEISGIKRDIADAGKEIIKIQQDYDKEQADNKINDILDPTKKIAATYDRIKEEVAKGNSELQAIDPKKNTEDINKAHEKAAIEAFEDAKKRQQELRKQREDDEKKLADLKKKLAEESSSSGESDILRRLRLAAEAEHKSGTIGPASKAYNSAKDQAAKDASDAKSGKTQAEIDQLQKQLDATGNIEFIDQSILDIKNLEVAAAQALVKSANDLLAVDQKRLANEQKKFDSLKESIKDIDKFAIQDKKGNYLFPTEKAASDQLTKLEAEAVKAGYTSVESARKFAELEQNIKDEYRNKDFQAQVKQNAIDIDLQKKALEAKKDELKKQQADIKKEADKNLNTITGTGGDAAKLLASIGPGLYGQDTANLQEQFDRLSAGGKPSADLFKRLADLAAGETAPGKKDVETSASIRAIASNLIAELGKYQKSQQDLQDATDKLNKLPTSNTDLQNKLNAQKGQIPNIIPQATTQPTNAPTPGPQANALNVGGINVTINGTGKIEYDGKQIVDVINDTLRRHEAVLNT